LLGILRGHSTRLDDPIGMIEQCIRDLSSASMNSETFYNVACVSLQNPVALSPPTSPGSDSLSPSPFDSLRSMPSLHLDLWDKDKNLNRLYRAMMEQLTPEKVCVSLSIGGEH
jgi:CLIP-associating protein 1/2